MSKKNTRAHRNRLSVGEIGSYGFAANFDPTPPTWDGSPAR